MEIELPDGTVLDAPDGSDPSVVAKGYIRAQRIAKIKVDNPAEYDPSSPEYQARNNPAAINSGLRVGIPGTDIGFNVPAPQSVENFAAGAGKAVTDAGRGLKQIGIEGYGLVRPKQAQDLIVGTPAEQYRRYIDETKRLDAPLLNTTSGLLGNVAGNVAISTLPGGLAGKAGIVGRIAGGIANPQTILGATASGGLLGALQPVGTNDSRTQNIVTGGLLSGGTQALVKTVGKIAEPVINSLSPEKAAAVKTLQDAAVPLDAAQVTGSERLSQAKRFLTDNPLTSAGQVAQAEATQRGFTRAALRTIGADAEAATPDVLNSALTKIEGTFDDIAKRASVKIDDKALNGLTNLSEQAKQVLEAPQAAIINRQIDEVISKAADTGSIPGNAYQNLRTTIGEISNSGSPGVRNYAGKLRGVLDDALQNSISGEDLAALKQARAQYRNFNAIRDAVQADTGTVTAPRLYQALNKESYGAKTALKTGRGETDLFELARAGKAIIPERLPNSGTAPRAALQLLPSALGAGYGYLKEGDLGGAAKYAALGAAVPFGLQRAINSPAGVRYLSQGIQSPLVRSALLGAPQSLPGIIARQTPLAAILASQNAAQ